MAYNNYYIKTWLGFENEFITDKHRNLVDLTTDKVGGIPDWPSNVSYDNLACNVCQFWRPLVLQVYAPLENSPYHRTLYLFACVNPDCHDQNKSWICLRSQILDDNRGTSSTVSTEPERNSVQWCVGQDTWDDENNINFNEENGNTLENNEEQMSDDESSSSDELKKIGFDRLQVDSRNANIGILDEARGVVMDQLHSPQAEIHMDESDETNFTRIETPTLPQQNLIALLKEVTPLPPFQQSKSTLQFVPFFLSFEPEESKCYFDSDDKHIDEILSEYQHQQKDKKDPPGFVVTKTEDYEEDLPTHGDKMLFRFKNKIDTNPGQLVRYSRGNDSPLLLKPLEEVAEKCQYCGAKLTFEFQLLPTVIPKLRFVNCPNQSTRLDFGTVIVFTCSTNCWSKDSSIRQEVLIVQTEEY